MDEPFSFSTTTYRASNPMTMSEFTSGKTVVQSVAGAAPSCFYKR